MIKYTFSQLAQHSQGGHRENEITSYILDVWAFVLFCFFSPLICHKGPKISEKLECTQLNKQTNLLKHFSGAHKLRLVCLFPNKHHS